MRRPSAARPAWRAWLLSSGAVTGGFDTTFHLPLEQAVEQSGLEWTHYDGNPADPAENTDFDPSVLGG